MNHDFSKLHREVGEAPYGYSNEENIYEFNICGTLGGLIGIEYPENATAVVYIKNSNSFSEVYTSSEIEKIKGRGNGFRITFSNEDETYRPLQLELKCNETTNETMVMDSIEVGLDSTTIRASSPLACFYHPMGHYKRGWMKHRTWYWPVLFGSIFLLSCICMCCAQRRRCKRLREQRRQQELNPIEFNDIVFHQVPTEEPEQSREEHRPTAPFFQAPVYFYHPSVQVPIQHSPAQVHVSDEQIARQLQAQYDAENRA
eukprot:TRINITY_DN389_c0_g1_i1.p1 TRINITY_DN389_c0_g1~~TRINITY_DN389_c0_g1_i1.p1  ORF type:complete len:258 (+),score=67.34 TRINITY_DN389_c0_g1_i1:118-891(+)